VRAATLRDNLPLAWRDGVAKYGPLFALCTSLLAVATMLWSKPAIVSTVKGMANMRAASITHLAIAWAWMTDLVPGFRDTSDAVKTVQDVFAIGNSLFSWLFGFPRMLFGFIIVICFSHLFAGVAQAGALLFLLYAFSGLEKWWETGSFSVGIPDPAAAAAAVRGGGGGGGGGGVAWGGGNFDDDADDVVPMGGGPDVFSAAVRPAVAVSPSIPFVPTTKPSRAFLDAVNQEAFRANKFAGPLVLALFSAVKMAGAPRMKTRAGKIFAWTASTLVGFASVGTVFLRAAPAAPLTLYW
jgi:hypothetical protein